MPEQPPFPLPPLLHPPSPPLRHLLLLPFPPSLRSAAAIAAKIKEAAKTKERCGYLTKQIVVSSWGENFKVFSRQGRVSRLFTAPLFFPGSHAPFISRQFNVIRGSLVPLSFPVLSVLAALAQSCARRSPICISRRRSCRLIGYISAIDQSIEKLPLTDLVYFHVACVT